MPLAAPSEGPARQNPCSSAPPPCAAATHAGSSVPQRPRQCLAKRDGPEEHRWVEEEHRVHEPDLQTPKENQQHVPPPQLRASPAARLNSRGPLSRRRSPCRQEWLPRQPRCPSPWPPAEPLPPLPDGPSLPWGCSGGQLRWATACSSLALRCSLRIADCSSSSFVT